MIDKGQLRTYIIEPVLKQINLYSPTAVNLLMGTCAQESHMGTFIKQVGKGPALGIFQMEPATHNDIWANFLKYKPTLTVNVSRLAIMSPDAEEMIGNLYYAAAMARIHYLRMPVALPADPNDVAGLARYWKKYYNTPLGAGTVEEFMENYEKFVA